MRRAPLSLSSSWRARMISAPFSKRVSPEVIQGHPRLGLKIRGNLSELTSASALGPHRHSASRVRASEPGEKRWVRNPGDCDFACRLGRVRAARLNVVRIKSDRDSLLLPLVV